MKYRFLPGFAAAAMALSICTAWIDPFKDKVSEGNRNYNDGKFSESIKNYRDAEKYAPGESEKKLLEFNRGNAEFRMNNHNSAIAGYLNSMNSGDPEVQKKALYNIGTAYMKSGKKREAAENFIRALRIDPSYEKAKRNLEYLLKRERQEKNQQNSGQGDGNKQDNKNPGTDKNDKGQGQSDDKKGGPQMKNMLESMKNKPVRRQKGKGGGEKYLEKFW